MWEGPLKSFLPQGLQTAGLQLVPFLLAGAFRYDKGTRLQRGTGNCPSHTTDVTRVPSSQRQLSSTIAGMMMRLCHFMELPVVLKVKLLDMNY